MGFLFKEAKMKKIYLFMLMIFGIFMLFATDAATETSQENAVAPETAQAPAENVLRWRVLQSFRPKTECMLP